MIRSCALFVTKYGRTVRWHFRPRLAVGNVYNQYLSFSVSLGQQSTANRDKIHSVIVESKEWARKRILVDHGLMVWHPIVTIAPLGVVLVYFMNVYTV